MVNALSTLEANFVQEYKVCGSPTKALRAAGCKLDDNALKVKAYRWMRKPRIRSLIDTHNDNLRNKLITPVITEIPKSIATLPDKTQFALHNWGKATNPETKEECAVRYTELTGKVLGHLGHDESSSSHQPSFLMLLKELNINISAPSNPLINNISNNDLSKIEIEREYEREKEKGLKVVTTSVVNTTSVSSALTPSPAVELDRAAGDSVDVIVDVPRENKST